MFEIEYKGANCVIISTKKARLVIDPKLSIVGLKDIKVKDAIEMVTESRFALNSPDSRLLINGPGEYGVADFDILGVPAGRHIDSDSDGFMSTVYRVEIDRTRIGVIGNIQDELTEEQCEKLGVLDILIIPVGGNGYTLDAASAAKLIRSIGPKIVIPVHYADKQIKYELPQDELSVFVAELDAPVEVTSKYKLKHSLIEQSPLTVVEITRN